MDKYQLKLLKFKNKKDMQPYVVPVFDLLEKTYGQLSSFAPIPDKEKERLGAKYLEILKPDFINIITDNANRLVGFAITLLSYAKALQKAKGSLWPLGWWHLLKAALTNDTTELLLIGILPEYRKKGLTAVIFNDIFKMFKKHGIKYIESNPMLVDNYHVQNLWKKFDVEVHKRRAVFRRMIGGV